METVNHGFPIAAQVHDRVYLFTIALVFSYAWPIERLNIYLLLLLSGVDWNNAWYRSKQLHVLHADDKCRENILQGGLRSGLKIIVTCTSICLQNIDMNASGIDNCTDTDITSPRTTRHVFTSLFLLASLVAIFFNTVNIWIIPKLPDVSPASKLCFVALSSADLVFAVVILGQSFGTASPTKLIPWSIKNIFCKATGYITTMVPPLTSTYLLLINIDRFIAVYRPLRYKALVSKRRVQIVLLSHATLAIVGSLLYFSLRSSPFDNITIQPISRLCRIDHGDSSIPLFFLYVFRIVAIWFQVVLIVIFSVSICVISRRHERKRARFQMKSFNANRNRSRDDNDKERSVKMASHSPYGWKAFKMVTMTTVAFIITHIPQSVVDVLRISMKIKLSSPECSSLLLVDAITDVFIVSRLFWNTLIFVVVKKSFRRAFCQLLCSSCPSQCCLCRRSR